MTKIMDVTPTWKEKQIFWLLLLAAAVVVFGAGFVVAKVRTSPATGIGASCVLVCLIIQCAITACDNPKDHRIAYHSGMEGDSERAAVLIGHVIGGGISILLLVAGIILIIAGALGI